ncbi:hypothetical protein, partial [Enterobacter hormaechei]|uniref:hypothetical protein n=1 Tax=Enterobacter hormaechei TaxID=158836 RepID=UPI001C3F1024
PVGVRRGRAGAAAGALAGWGSTTGQQRWPGAEGGQKWDSGVFREFAERVSEPPRHATPRHATPRHATQDRIRDNLPPQCHSSAFLLTYTRGGRGQRRRRWPCRPVSPKG